VGLSMAMALPAAAGDRRAVSGFAPWTAPADAGMPRGLVAQSDHERARQGVQSGQLRPLRQILAGIQNNFYGRQLNSSVNQYGGSWVYNVTWLTPQGNVLNIVVDGQSGRILNVAGQGAGAARR